MKAILHNYQKRAVAFIRDHPKAALLLDMGLGKSLITLTAISNLIDDMEIAKVLVIAPKKVAETTWTGECNKWDHLQYLRVSRVMGTEKKRIKALQAEADIYVIGRDSFVWLCKYYKARLPYDMIVIDELTSFKNNTSLRFKAFKLIRASIERIVGLTGTPAPNGYLDLWAQIYCLDGGQRLSKFITHYREKYFTPKQSRQGRVIGYDIRPGATEEINNRIYDMCLVMKSEEYLTLPACSKIVTRVELPPDVLQKYRTFERQKILQIAQENNVTATSAAALMNKLLQFCNGAVYGDADSEGHCPVNEIHKEKITALLEIYEAAKSPVLVFYQFIHDKQRLIKAIPKSIKVRVYESEQDFNDWNAGEIDILLAHPLSCSYGLNLQAGGHVIVWFGIGYNLEAYQQANARLHRQGQKHPVMIYHLICPNTVEECTLRALQQKTQVQDRLMNDVKELIKKYT